MAKRRASDPINTKSKMRPALSPENREGQMIALAMDLVEQRLRDGTASSQETTHFLKLGTAKYRTELRILETQEALNKAKTKAYDNQEEIKVLYEDALKAMRNYAGQGEPDEY